MRTKPAWLKRLAEPTGCTPIRDGTVLWLWELYAHYNHAERGQDTWCQTGNHDVAGRGTLLAQSKRTHEYFSPSFYVEHITRSLLPFWLSNTPDEPFGGFITHLNRRGNAYDKSFKTAAMHGRLIYAFSIGYELTHDPAYRAAAQQGVEFLLRTSWDRQQGGWFESVNRDGSERDCRKTLVTQAYALVGLLEYHRIIRDRDVLDPISVTFELLERHGRDWEHDGYFETCERDWTPASTKKTACIHLDVLKAFLSRYRVTGEHEDLAAAQHLANLIALRMRDARHACPLERFHRNWRYNPLATRDQVEIGHSLKAARLLLTLFELTRDTELRSTAEGLVRFCLSAGWDPLHGGFWQHVYRNGTLASPEKLWWPECEGLQVLLLMYRLTDEPCYLHHFGTLAHFWFHHFADPEFGEWYRTCAADGTVWDDSKGATWKTAYHPVEACFHASRYLTEALPLDG